MEVRELNVQGIALPPTKANAPLIVDSDAVGANSITGELLERGEKRLFIPALGVGERQGYAKHGQCLNEIV